MKRFLLLLLLSGILFNYTKAQKTLKVGVISYKSDEKIEATFKPVFQYLANEMGKELIFNIVSDEDLAYHLDKQDYDIGVFTIFPYLKAKEDFPDLHVFASHKVNNDLSFQGVILTKKGNKVTELHQLENKDFLFVKPTSTSGYKFPKGIFTESDLDIDNNFFKYDFSYDHNRSLDSLIAGTVDGIAIDESYFTERNDINHDDYLVLARYEVPYPAYVFAPGLSAKDQQEIEKTLYTAHKDPKSKKLFNNPIGVSSIVPEDDDYYNVLRRYLRITRVKPVLDLHIKPLGKAAEKMVDDADLLRLVEDKASRGLLKSGRFVASAEKKNQYYEHVLINLYQISKGIFHYQVLLNDVLVDEGKDISTSELTGSFHTMIRNSVLNHLPIETDLLFNGKNWFINYGHNDGLSESDYVFEIRNGYSSTTLKKEDLLEMTDLNTRFKSNNEFEKGSTVKIVYKGNISQASMNDEESGEGSINIFSGEFWRTHYWDKLGLIIGILLTVLSALTGVLLKNRKQKKFKGLLHETNELIKGCIGDYYKMEAKIIEQKERVAALLESGKINENQFIILKNRISDLQNILDGMIPKKIQLTAEQKEQIEEIVSDGKITEREFLKIKSILKNKDEGLESV